VINNLLDILEAWWIDFQENIPQIIAGILVFVLSYYIARLFSQMLKRAMKKRKSDPELTVLLSRILRWTIIILGLILALEQAGQNVSALIASLGIIGFTIGFALQDVSSNLVAGLLLLYQQPFDLGDSIEVAGYAGTVKEIDLRATEMKTFDGLSVTIPNKDIYTNTITNFSRTNQRRIEHSFAIPNYHDIEFIQKLLLRKFEEMSLILKKPAPVVKFDNFDNSTINLSVYLWYETNKHGFVDVNNLSAIVIKEVLDDANIEMALPTRMVMVEKKV
jgi:small-conductance mechanosensitive channel